MDRHEEHKKSASNGGGGSKLYTEYPAKDSSRAQLARRNKVRPYPWKAYFEDLALFCGMGFVCSETVEQYLAVDNEDSEPSARKGIFSWSKQTIDALNKWEKDGETTLRDKQLHMVTYLLELMYDLMLSTDWNVSTQPGFEKFGLINLTRM